MPQTLTDIKSLLAAHGLHPKHRLGQNFLHDHNQINRIIDAAAIAPGDLVLEVGPGTGTLSEALLDAGAVLIAVEIDRDLEPVLQQRLADRATLVFDDVLAGKHALNPTVCEAVGGRAFKLIANLPYNVASPLLVNLAIDHLNMSQAIVMVQREAADRLLASPGSRAYGPLTIMVSAMCDVSLVGHLSATCFWPQPQVESAVLKLVRRAQPRCGDVRALGQLVHRLFTQRRKQLGAVLGRDRAWPSGIEPIMRAEQLSVEQLAALVC